MLEFTLQGSLTVLTKRLQSVVFLRQQPRFIVDIIHFKKTSINLFPKGLEKIHITGQWSCILSTNPIAINNMAKWIMKYTYTLWQCGTAEWYSVYYPHAHLVHFSKYSRTIWWWTFYDALPFLNYESSCCEVTDSNHWKYLHHNLSFYLRGVMTQWDVGTSAGLHSKAHDLPFHKDEQQNKHLKHKNTPKSKDDIKTQSFTIMLE